jgi:anti-sigma regulatory factor (Ser/Thr protein kinase)
MDAPQTLRVPADLRSLAKIRRFLRQMVIVPPEDHLALEELVCAVDESVTNIVVHGYRGERGTIDIELERDVDAVVVRLRDEAPRFDPTSEPPPDVSSPLEERPAGGLDPSDRCQVDEMTHRELPDGGNELTLVKRLAGRSATSLARGQRR